MTLLLVDGHYYLYRSFFAIRGLRNSRGEPTNAIYAFIKALRKMIADVSPTHGAVLWDAGLPAHRVDLLPGYKQQRDPMPEDLAVQEQKVIDLCPHLGLHSIFVQNTEADDLIAAYATAATAASQARVVIATNDKDILQLTSDRVSIYSTTKSDLELCGTSTKGFALLGPKEVENKWGVPPCCIGDVLSLTGDSSDNIPGVPGVGQKTAVALVKQFGSLENLLHHLPDISNPKLRTKIEEHAALIRINQEMVRLQAHLPLTRPLEDLSITPDSTALLKILRDCEFRSLTAEVERESMISHSSASTPAPTSSAKPQAQQGELF